MRQTKQVTQAATAANQNEEATQLVAYIRDMLRELQQMAPAEAGAMLPYLIEMAREEAESIRKRLAFAAF